MLLRLRISKAIGLLSAMKASKQFELLQLPNELIALIVEQVDDQRTLQSLARTCRRVQEIAERKLYRRILIRSLPKAKAIDRALKVSPRHAKAIEILDIPCDKAHPAEGKALEDIVKSATNLKEIMFEGPRVNSSDSNDFEDARLWLDLACEIFGPLKRTSLLKRGSDLESPLPLWQLQKLTLHINGPKSPYWTANSFRIGMFLHPTLQELRISCLNILDDMLERVPDSLKFCTPLKTLILEECNISDNGLRALLSLPKALETLYLGENCHNFDHFDTPIPEGSNDLFLRRADLAVEALKQQKHSLKSLTYATRCRHTEMSHQTLLSHYQSSFVVNGGFSDFHMLEDVTLVGWSPLFERCLMSSTPPPNLKRLACKSERLFVHGRGTYEMRPDKTTYVKLIPFLRAPSASIPGSLKELDITYTDRAISVKEVKEFLEELPFVRAIVKETSKVGVNLRFFATRNEGSQWFYPPYLYGEQEPEEVLVLDGALLEDRDVEDTRSLQDLSEKI